MNPNYQLWFEHEKSEAAPLPKKNNIQESKKPKQSKESKAPSDGEQNIKSEPDQYLNN